MPFDWDEYLTLSKKIAARTATNEALKRTAVSRAYYAVAHIADIYARTRLSWPGVGRGGGWHSSLAQFYRNQLSNTSFQEVGSKLRTLRDLREECDYDDTITNINGNLSLAISEAEDIKNLLC
jgi:uncharacterized protein (UPF0332 family)